MYKITYALASFDADADLIGLSEVVDELCIALAEANVKYLLDEPDTPLLYESGVRYKIDKLGNEVFKDIPLILQHGSADCKSLAAWRAAELLVFFDIPAIPFTTFQVSDSGDVMFHAQVRTRHGIEDPSIELGMRV